MLWAPCSTTQVCYLLMVPLVCVIPMSACILWSFEYCSQVLSCCIGTLHALTTGCGAMLCDPLCGCRATALQALVPVCCGGAVLYVAATHIYAVLLGLGASVAAFPSLVHHCPDACVFLAHVQFCLLHSAYVFLAYILGFHYVLIVLFVAMLACCQAMGYYCHHAGLLR